MSEHPNLKRHAALFFALFPVSRGLFAAAEATRGIGCGCLSGLLSVFSWAAFAASLIGMAAIGAIALMRARKLECAVTPSILAMIPVALLFCASAPWTLGADEAGIPFGLADLGRWAPFAAGLAAVLLLVSDIRQRRRGVLPPARVIGR